MQFTHLHSHTEYSLLDGSNKIKEYVEAVRDMGMKSAAITDHGSMFGVIDFYKAAKKADIKPILGCEVYVAPESRFDRDISTGEERYYHLVLLAENNEGYQNLMKLVSLGWTDGYYYKPRVDMEILEKYHEGLIALSACLAGEIPKSLMQGDYEGAKAAALRHETLFGKGNFFLELQNHGMEEQLRINPLLIRLSEETGIELVATNDVHYTYREDAKPHDILLCIQTGKKLADENRMRYQGDQFYVKSPEEMDALFGYAKGAIENTNRIAERCNVSIEFGVSKLPKFDVPQDTDAFSYLTTLCKEGFYNKYTEIDAQKEERLEYELNMIRKMGYVDYFLIVWDFIKYARDNGIMVGPGRGSAAGSIVSYCLGITNIEPLQYQLLFERFLNPERVSMPDIDIDFGFERRQEVIDYVVEKYGAEQVAQIITFGRLMAKAVVRDVGRVMDMPYSYVDSIAKMIPFEAKITLDKAIAMNPELAELINNDPSVNELITMAKRLEGLPRNQSVHAAGVVICQHPVTEYVPLSLGSDGSAVTEFDKDMIEELGLLKMDFLGIRTLSVIQNTVFLVEKSQGISIDIDKLTYDDKAVFDYIGSGKTDGVFQLESSGMKDFMINLKPQSFEDIIAGISLYRPGPMDFIPKYIQGKKNQDYITYDCPELEPILKPTYGCIVYQEQVMQIVRDLAGYSLGRSDILRRAMGKKKADVMEKERHSFIFGNPEEGVPGCVANGIDQQVAIKIFDEITVFAEYAFNKSHAAAYAVVCYQTAYLKYYYPVEFMASLMTSVIDFASKVSGYIYSCRQMNIKILPPDINQSMEFFSVSAGAIRYGLCAIKGIGKSVANNIIIEREEGGPFLSLNDFIERLSGREVNKRTIESFIKAGAFDVLGGTRKQHMHAYVSMIDQVQKDKKDTMKGQINLFDLVEPEVKESFQIQLPDVGEYSKDIQYGFEKEVLGVYASGHPLEDYEKQWKKGISKTTLDFEWQEPPLSPLVEDNAKEIVGGIITERVIKHTKTNQIMAFLTLEDLAGTLEVIVFPKTYKQFQHELSVDKKVFINGRVSFEEEQASKLILESIKPFKEPTNQVWLLYPNKAVYFQEEEKLKELLSDSEGLDDVVIFAKEEKAPKQWPPHLRIDANEETIAKLENFLGKDRVKVIQKDVE